MPSVQEFGVRYCAGVKNAWGWDFNGHSNLEELNIFMSSHFMIRRLKVRNGVPPSGLREWYFEWSN